ncbi:hypothetical protein [Kitasatospora sp. NPDC087314]|uniref:hypothetical protein n=1 Tax=Kitasatospora sp. NPDC087314 TaxID=3364068 RepID=UPI0038017E24
MTRSALVSASVEVLSVGAQAQVAVLGGLAAGDAHGLGEFGPGGAAGAGGIDQARFPARKLGAQLAQQHQRGQRGLRSLVRCTGTGPGGRAGVLGGADGIVDGGERGGGEEGRRSCGRAASGGRRVGPSAH